MATCCKDLVALRLATAVLLLCVARLGDAAEFRCGALDASVLAESARDAALACEGAAAAIDFLRSQGLDVAADVRIEIVPALTEDDNGEAAGFFYAATGRVVILNRREFMRFGTWMRAPVSDELYKGLVTHEVAHLIARRNFKTSRPTIQAQEYIAYVTTLATLESGQRELILSKFPGDGYETEQQMNTTIYLCDPMRFGVEAYRHFLKKGRNAGYFDAILTGRVLAE